MPDFGLSAALEAALKGGREAKVMLPGEAELAARAGARSAAPEAGAAAIRMPAPKIEPVGLPDIQAPRNVAIPAPEQPPPPAATPPGDVQTSPQAGQPADPAVAASTTGAAGDVAAPAASTDVIQPPGLPKAADPAAPTAPKQGVPDPSNAPATVAEASAAAPKVAPIEAAPPEVGAVAESAARIARADMGDFALDASHMPNFDTMTSPNQIKATIAQLAEDNKAGITAARRDVITNEQLQGLVNDLPGGDPVMIRQVLERESGGVLSPEVTLAARQFEQASAGRIAALAQQIQAGNKAGIDTNELLAQYARQKQLHVAFAEQLMGSRAEQGRGLNAFSTPVGAPPEVMQRLAEILKSSNPNMEQELAAVSMTNTAKGVASILQGIPQGSLLKRIFGMSVPTSTGGTTPGAIMGFVNRVFVNGILSSPYTWLSKIGVGNTTNLIANSLDIGAAAVVGKFMTGTEHVQIGEMIANMHGNISATRDAFRMAYRILKTGESLGNVVRFAEGAPQDTNRILPEINGTTFGKVMNVVDQVINAPGNRFVNAVDSFNQTLAYRGFMERQAYIAVNDALSSGTLAQEDAATFVTNMMNNPDPALQQAAQHWAYRMSFQDPLGESGQAITNWLQKNPVARLIVPFMRTSVNILKQSLGERTPMALFTQRFQNAVAAGGRDRDMAIGRMVTGTMFCADIARRVLAGNITGAGPQDPKARAAWESDGKRPYSVATTNADGVKTWHSLANFEPLATLLGVTADTIEIGSYIHADDTSDSMLNNEAKWKEAVSHVVVGAVNNTVNKTYMMGILKFSEMLADPTRGFDNWKNQMVAGLDPFSSMQRLIRNETDPYMRQASTLLDTLKNQTPFVSKTLPLVKDIYGAPRMVKSGSVLGVMSPIPDSTQATDPVTRELVAVMNQTRTVPISMPSRNFPIGDGSGRGLQGGTSMRLTDREYSEYVDIARAEPIYDGKTFKEHLQETIDSAQYERLTPALRAEALAAVANTCDKIARIRLLAENPDFAERHSQVVAQKNQMKFPQ